MRYLFAVLLMGLLAACDLGAASPSSAPLPSLESEAASTEPMESEDADASADADGMAASCEEAWAEIDVSSIDGIEDLEAVAADVDVTIEECESLDEWVAEAEDVLPNLDAAEFEAWAATRCSESDTLSESPVCVEISG